MADKAILVAKDHQELMGIKNITYHNSNLENFVEVSHQQYDVLTCMEMLEHVPSPEQIIASCSKAVKNGGHLFLSTINRNIKSYLMAIVGAEYILKLLPQGTHEFDSFIKPSEIEKWSRKSGFNLIDLTGVMYNPITKGFKLTDDVSVNYMMYFRKD
jgi:2-polyprenyl-6-hydroxyphenyl methylase/3-demethylubiquinone-9 3-methyltransferase